mmetsp:Transcript_71751/g.187052  ORF Transcript_71751/g.187052 Transcript_71751/m.187052 type:complete len:267 (-) Transcript_71751:964-1764(-)
MTSACRVRRKYALPTVSLLIVSSITSRAWTPRWTKYCALAIASDTSLLPPRARGLPALSVMMKGLLLPAGREGSVIMVSYSSFARISLACTQGVGSPSLFRPPPGTTTASICSSSGSAFRSDAWPLPKAPDGDTAPGSSAWPNLRMLRLPLSSLCGSFTAPSSSSARHPRTPRTSHGPTSGLVRLPNTICPKSAVSAVLPLVRDLAVMSPVFTLSMPGTEAAPSARPSRNSWDSIFCFISAGSSPGRTWMTAVATTEPSASSRSTS